jgi:hypothetical protein
VNTAVAAPFSSPVELKAAPQWATAAQLLVDGCAHAPDAAYRTELLERLCLSLGDQLYPAFLTVLCRVGEMGSPAAQSAVAEALVDALRSGRLPAGRRAAWGAQRSPSSLAQTPSLQHSQAQSLGPIEYLCAWYVDPGPHEAPSAAAFDRAMQSLLRLVGHSPRARSLYAQRLRALAEDPLGGTLSRHTRGVLQQLAEAWAAPQATPQSASDACLQAMGRSGFGALGAPELPRR